MRISDWSSDVCSSDLLPSRYLAQLTVCLLPTRPSVLRAVFSPLSSPSRYALMSVSAAPLSIVPSSSSFLAYSVNVVGAGRRPPAAAEPPADPRSLRPRSEEHTSELQSLMRISYAVFCLQKKKTKQQ